MALIVDLSGSVAPYTGDLKAAVNASIDGLAGTPSNAAMFTFATRSPAEGAEGVNTPKLVSVSTEAQADAFLEQAKIADWAPSGNTNYDEALLTTTLGNTADNKYDLALFITDGAPTVVENGVKSAAGGEGQAAYLSANNLKAQGTRVVAVGVGDGLTGEGNAKILQGVSGTVEYDGTNATSADYFRTDNYQSLAGLLEELAKGDCDGSLTVTKYEVPFGGTIDDAVPGSAGWEFSVANPSSGIKFINGTTKTTDDNPTVGFDMAFNSSTKKGTVELTETAGATHSMMQVNGKNAVCVNLSTGDTVSVENIAGGVKVPVAPSDGGVNCSIYNQEVPPKVDFTKSSKITDTNGNGYIGDPGDTIAYTFKVTNSGLTVVNSAKLSDNLLGLKDYECLAAPLAPGKSVNCKEQKPGDFSHIITDSEGEAGKVVNNATITVPGIPDVPGTTTTPTVKPEVKFVKKVLELKDSSETGLGTIENGAYVGDTLVYGFEVSNIGNVDLTSVLVSDELLGVSDHECIPAGESLKVGATALCVGEFTYVVTEADAVNGAVENHAILSGPGLPEVPGEVTTPTKNPGLAMEKKVLELKDTSGTGLGSLEKGAMPGDTLVYTFELSNTGNADLSSVILNDELLNVTGHECIAEGSVIKPGETVNCQGEFTYVVTKDDAKAGEVLNSATAETPGVPEVPAEVVSPTVDPGFDFEKKIIDVKDAKGNTIKDGKIVEGAVVHYGFTFTNTGNVDLKGLTVTDPMLKVKDVQCLAKDEVLAPGKTVTCVDNKAYHYKVTAGDAKKGQIHNTAVGALPGTPPIEVSAGVGITFPATKDAVVKKTGVSSPWFIVAAGSSLALGGAYIIFRSQRKATK